MIKTLVISSLGLGVGFNVSSLRYKYSLICFPMGGTQNVSFNQPTVNTLVGWSITAGATPFLFDRDIFGDFLQQDIQQLHFNVSRESLVFQGLKNE